LSDSDWIFDEVGLGIKALVERFTQTPYFFYSEQDMHAYLYYRLVSGRLGSLLIDTCFGDRSVLVHREYPTLHAYGRKRGHFDLAIIDPEHASKSHWRMQVKEPPYARHRLKVAVEFGLNAIGTTRLDLTHFRKDFEHLTNPENMVERGYLLFFVRKQDFLPTSGMLRVIDGLPNKIGREYERNQSRAGNLAVVYVECSCPGKGRTMIVPTERSP
jgi:hypothetical protein